MKEETKTRIKYLLRKVRFKRGGDVEASGCPYKTWDELKQSGSQHYKREQAQMIDIYKAKGTFTAWALNEVTQHAQRNSPLKRDCFVEDMVKNIHYCELLIAEHFETQSGVTAAEREGLKDENT